MTDGSDRRFDQTGRNSPAESGEPPTTRLILWRWLVIVLWSAAVAASLVWNIHLHDKARIDQAYSQAVAVLEKDMGARALVA
ncbi:MAG: hypothetical protein HND59_10410 [Pseudomonadota bacterium]|nr:MAG: hypothetical protein HND59_10410 [Pseudomonadota bacterium]